MGKINSSPEAIREFAKEIRTFMEGQTEVISRLDSYYGNLNADWNDAQYQKFGECLEMVKNGIGSILPTCEETINQLERKAATLEEYNS